MTAADAPISEAQKLKLPRQIQYLLGQTTQLLVRDAGLTQREFEVLADELLIEVSFFRDEGLDLDRYHIDKILPKGLMVLAQSDLAAPDPLRVTVVTPPKSVCRRIFEGTRSGLWDLIKIAFGAALGWIAAHFGR
ncbi:MAG: hypothetical protein ACREFE_10795 [Limisphaerales bacterium]